MSGERTKNEPRAAAPGAGWTVYIVRCANGSLYTGITNGLGARLAAHNSGTGARYTAAFGPVRLVWSRRSSDRSSASRLEAAIKRLGRPEKEKLIRSGGARLPSFLRRGP